jgi:alkanesulfonate monooxygenase SsuD/methylene tetrahydromethanopterin reductase-like flavin-dependent oxidoreductase (luciferase family)
VTHANAVELRGFEEALFNWTASAFRFSGESLKSIPLEVGRHFTVNHMREVREIAAAHAGAVMPYDPAKEPTITAYTNAGPGLRTSASRWVKHEASLNFHLRVAGTYERAKALLEELVQYILRSVKGKRVGTFQVKSAIQQQRPVPYQRQEDDRSYAQATVRFLYVALNV